MMFLPATAVLFLIGLVAHPSSAAVSQSCLDCLRATEGGDFNTCTGNGKSTSCGAFRITEDYWKKSGKSGKDWKTCTKQIKCSEKSVQGFMKNFARKCIKDRTPTCEEYGRIHRGGPTGCRWDSPAIEFGKQVGFCCLNKSGGC
jgi:hypothetical protein